MIDGCLSEVDLDRLHAREMSPEEVAENLAHLEACPVCARRDAQMRERQECLVRRLQGLPLTDLTFESSGSSDSVPSAFENLARVGGSSADPITRPSNGADPGDPASLLVKGVKIIREVQRGGQGVVYEGLQQWPRRRVAVKVLRDSMLATRQERYRIEQEIEVLGQLRHPAIVSIHFSGTCDAGRYYVMDYVDGVPLDQWMARPQCSVRDKIEAFAAICDGVHAAHLRGILHRDLKPANILMDADGRPHILDFGLAKIASSDQATRHGVTNTGVFLGTLAWASPEQLHSAGGEFDLRGDVYSLGVLLYQALAGAFPYDVSGSVPETIHNILNADPARPRSKAIPVDTEIQAILFKCLEKDPSQRYQSAGELAEELRRYLRGEPVEAKRHSTLYTLKKIAGRHKAVVTLAAVLLIAIIGSAVFMAWSLKTITQKNRSVTEARIAAEASLAEAVKQGELAEHRGQAALQRSYDHYITMADYSQALGRMGVMAAALDAAPEPLRRWEWLRLSRMCDDSTARLTDLQGDAWIAEKGKRLAVPKDGWIYICDLESLQALQRIPNDADSVEQVAFSADGRRLAGLFRSSEVTVRVYDTDRGSLLLEWPGAGVQCIAMSDDGSVLLLRDAADVHHVKYLACMESTEGNYNCQSHDCPPGIEIPLDVSGDGRHAVLVGNYNHTYIYDTKTFTLQHDLPRPPEFGTSRLMPDGKVLHYGHQGAGIRKLDPADPEATLDYTIPREIFTRPWEERINLVALSPDRKLLAGSDDKGTIFLWNYQTSEFVRALRGHKSSVTGMAFVSPSHLVSNARHETLRQWQLDVHQPVQPVGGSGHSLIGMGRALYMNDGQRVLTSAAYEVGGEISIWSLDQPNVPLRRWNLDWRPYVATLSPDESQMVVVGEKTDVYVYDLLSGDDPERLGGHQRGIPYAEFAPDGRTFVTAGWDQSVIIWDSQTHRRLHHFRHSDEFWEACYSPDGRWVAAGARDGSVFVWEADSGRLAWSKSISSEPIDTLAFSPSSQRLATSGFDRTIRIWDTSTFTQHRSMVTNSEHVFSAIYTDDGERLIIGGSRVVEVWDPESERMHLATHLPVGSVYSLDLSPVTQDLMVSGLSPHAWLMETGQRSKVVEFPF